MMQNNVVFSEQIKFEKTTLLSDNRNNKIHEDKLRGKLLDRLFYTFKHVLSLSVNNLPLYDNSLIETAYIRNTLRNLLT